MIYLLLLCACSALDVRLRHDVCDGVHVKSVDTTRKMVDCIALEPARFTPITLSLNQLHLFLFFVGLRQLKLLKSFFQVSISI